MASMNDLPEPLVPSDVDLRGFTGFMLDVERLLASELVALGTPEECWFALMLWCRAWQQQPPASLPNDERVLAAFSRAGAKWKKVRDIVLRGFVLCSDGRLYHKVLAEEALTAWEKRKKYQERSAKANAKRWADHGDKESYKDAKDSPTRMQEGVQQGDQKDSKTPPVEVEVEGTGKPNSVPNGTDADASNPGMSAKERIFHVVVPWMVDHGVTDKNARSLMAGAAKELGDDGAWQLGQELIREAPLQPASWLAAALNARMPAGKGKGKQSRHSGFDKIDYREGVNSDGSF
ncbi:YdaU family protein [Paraburkholderia bryophila]|uniref:DUF1376 domain-containing protein n=1 Tax=Paraburkholderia bryophila TaxID=420952 RepID=UPI00234ADCA1|nr:DUF1376 domain-containing protein [Paraburkholderia bryophila]WCM21393.1 YdaU family protein [Paraburkholderia bryophila]